MVPIYWRVRLARLWMALAAIWGGVWVAIVVSATEYDDFWRWFFDARSPGWIWLIAPPLGLGALLHIGGWLAWGVRVCLGPAWHHLSFETLLADAPPERSTDEPEGGGRK